MPTMIARTAIMQTGKGYDQSILLRWSYVTRTAPGTLSSPSTSVIYPPTQTILATSI